MKFSFAADLVFDLVIFAGVFSCKVGRISFGRVLILNLCFVIFVIPVFMREKWLYWRTESFDIFKCIKHQYTEMGALVWVNVFNHIFTLYFRTIVCVYG